MKKSICKVFVTLMLLAAFATPALASMSLDYYVSEIQKLLTEKRINSMMDVTRALKQGGASFQKDLALPTGLAKTVKSGESAGIMVGMYQFDAVYAVAFGRKKDAAGYMQAQDQLMNRLNMRGQLEVSALFPPAFKKLVKTPDKISFEEVVKAYAANTENYTILMQAPGGFDVVEDSLYGFIVEALYVVSNAIILSDYDPTLTALLADTTPVIQPVLDFYEAFTSEDYAKFVDDENFLEQGQRAGWLKMLLKMIISKKDNLTEKQVRAVASIAARERATVIADGN
ncbi:hypothetical protein [Desulfovibrio ferrophilus]|uniref:Cyclotide 2 n=1 Tax=Desulfovibrio ferrophilus TaxID=241368 RepID=A0A2Z6AWY8_9BACT|nr:hypothetical protein [Desulfovibrio ferrophilus]BBD07713.1 cyclotide 2 [Desulfovibrio ferrophilus]